MALLGLTEDELCRALAVDPLTLLSGQLEHRPELAILITLLHEASEQAGPATLRRWVRATGPAGLPDGDEAEEGAEEPEPAAEAEAPEADASDGAEPTE